MRRFWIANTAFFVVTLIAIWLVGLHTLPKAAEIIIVLLPMVPAAFILLAQMDIYRCRDELMRKIVAEALIFSWLCAVFLLISYTFLHIVVDLPYLEGWEVWVVMCVLYGAGVFIGTKRYR